jgi:hypothetical protein
MRPKPRYSFNDVSGRITMAYKGSKILAQCLGSIDQLLVVQSQTIFWLEVIDPAALNPASTWKRRFSSLLERDE